ncbi:MAG: hypothetical protein HY907_22115 [Deltaproteobacteria bacterium]|nr:hypothetical protein [Deltaproteobacteria bacterium]
MAKTLSLLVALASVPLMTPDAEAQVYIGGSVGVSIGGYVAVPAPPVVIYQPAPPPVVVYTPPPIPIVTVRPVPVQTATIQVAPAPVEENPFQSEIGIGGRANAGITGSEATGMGGAGAFLRFHSFPNFAFELGTDYYIGEGFAGATREEVPIEFSVLWFFGRWDSPFRLFLSTGVGAAWARVGEGERIDEPWYVGAMGGIGIEWRLIPSLALVADLRGFVRQRVNDRPADPEYALDPMWNDGNCNESGECTDLQGGGTLNVGAILYF